ncbi:7tm Odorant receptor [Popillia japonica]|uniref:7tm Odorant receptor n=1 Tax=Popillia japonica TaxID=7064 RepID=A0AAW1K1S4_POPJA
MFNIIVMILMLFYILLDFYRVNGETYAKVLQSTISVCHTLLKYLLMIHFKEDVEILRNTITSELDKYKCVMSKKAIGYLRTIQHIEELITMVGATTVYIYLLRPLLNSNYFLLLETALPDSLALNAIMLLCQYYFMWMGYLLVFGYDLTYFVCCEVTVLQMQLLKRRLVEITNSEDFRIKSTIRPCIAYHQTLLLIYSQMRSMYSTALLFHYFVTIITMCSDLFVLIGIMWSYEKEVERLTGLCEEVPTDIEGYSDSDDSVADAEFEEMTQHDSESELEAENDEELLSLRSNTAMQDNLYFQTKDGTNWRKIVLQKMLEQSRTT